MKKISILTLLFMFTLTAVFSQSVFRQTTSNSTGAITNTSVDTMNYTLSSSYHHVSIQPVVTKATGTMAGTCILQQSVNGTNYVNTDTLTLTNITTNTVIWTKTTAARYFRIITGGATTVTATAEAKLSAAQ